MDSTGIIQEQVREKYASAARAVAEEGSSRSCCGSDDKPLQRGREGTRAGESCSGFSRMRKSDGVD